MYKIKNISKWITLGLVPAFVLSGCGGGSNPFSCDFNVFFNGDSDMKSMVDIQDLKGDLSPYDLEYSASTDTDSILADIASGHIAEKMALLEDGVDIAVVNAGMWDIINNSPATNPHNRYRQNLTEILGWYQGEVNDVVFMLTLGDDNRTDAYNAVAVDVCDTLGVLVFNPNDAVDELDNLVDQAILMEAFNFWLAQEFECVPF